MYFAAPPDTTATRSTRSGPYHLQPHRPVVLEGSEVEQLVRVGEDLVAVGHEAESRLRPPPRTASPPVGRRARGPRGTRRGRRRPRERSGASPLRPARSGS